MSGERGTCTCCGACCVSYRATFLRHELDSVPQGWVPTELTEPVNRRGVRMRHAADHPTRCIALRGTIGVDVSCSIYPKRPSPCRAFAPGAGEGHGDVACGNARRSHGLPPLPGSYEGFPIA